MELASGQVAGRTVGDVLAAALEAADSDDLRSAARDKRAEYLP